MNLFAEPSPIESEFKGRMFKMARLCGVGRTQSELAEAMRESDPSLLTSQASISRWEDLYAEPSDEELKVASAVMKFPIEFFVHDGEQYGIGACCLYHRKKKKLPAKVLQAVHARVNVIGIGVEQLLSKRASIRSHCNLPTYRVAPTRTPESIARKVRKDLGIAPGPVRDLMASVEATGAIVILMNLPTGELDAISVRPSNAPPLVFLSRHAPADRQRWTLAHELGHLVMHDEERDGIEKEADQFAAELLMPASTIRTQLKKLTLETAGELKQEWRTSIQSIVRRAVDTKAITAYRSRTLYAKLGRLGGMRYQGGTIPRDVPTTLQRVIDAHRRRLKRSLDDLARLTFCVDADQFQNRFMEPDQRWGVMG